MKDIIKHKTAKFAKSLGINIRSHCGYLEENPNKPVKMPNAVQWYKGRYAAPKQSDLQSELRKEGIHVIADVIYNDKLSYVVSVSMRGKTYFMQSGYDSWEEALEEGLVEGLKVKQIPMILKDISKKTNRHERQVKFLYELMDGNIEMLKQVEMNIKNCFLHYCPGDMKEVRKILDMKPKKEWFKL